MGTDIDVELVRRENVELANGFEVGIRDKEKLKVASKLLA